MFDLLNVKPILDLGLAGVALSAALWFAFIRLPQLMQQFSDDLRAAHSQCHDAIAAHDQRTQQNHAEVLARLDRFPTDVEVRR